MEIIRHSNAKKIKKESGTEITYHIFDEYELNINTVPPHTEQDWHFHKIKEEVILILKGALDIKWKDRGRTMIEKLAEGDLVRVENTLHCLTNSYDEYCTFLCLKLVLDGENKRKILAQDKYKE